MKPNFQPLLLLSLSALSLFSCGTREEQKPKENYVNKTVFFEISPEFDYSGEEYAPVEFTVILSAGITDIATGEVTTLLDSTFHGSAHGFEELVPSLFVQRLDSIQPEKEFAWYSYAVGAYHTVMFINNSYSKYETIDENENELSVEVSY
ncbi:hypothetical protein QWY31_05295 [Cytophagales bacterium LB-30]|uniref:Lipoprotein n=1 Tax=Shiella aurantiaca TaxID=3058365 RepID=A0ABT8F377_9BACT|nr:hypothetical protein [Shiella aurantiaca]MDN4164905.1 hypothetical protein [Shiella aurantiaca]